MGRRRLHKHDYKGHPLGEDQTWAVVHSLHALILPMASKTRACLARAHRVCLVVLLTLLAAHYLGRSVNDRQMLSGDVPTASPPPCELQQPYDTPWCRHVPTKYLVF